MLNPNCSEAVFRLHTDDPAKMGTVIRALWYDCVADGLRGLAPKGYKVPFINDPSDVDSIEFPAINHDARFHYEPNKHSFIVQVGNNVLTDRMDKDGSKFIETIKKLDIPVEEAEYSKALETKYARDCTCGITYFDGYSKLIKGK